MEIKIVYQERELTIQGRYIKSNIINDVYEAFEIDDVKCNDVDAYDDYDLYQQLDIEKLCIKAIKL